jgi:site-specific DNA recombinase
VRVQLERNYKLCKRNKKNEYLLGGLIYCSCGCRRTGEGVYSGKHLYYRCTDRVLRFPLPKKCLEKGLNARIVDEMVWNKFIKIISSPNLLKAQALRYSKQKKGSLENTLEDTDQISKEINKLKQEELRYNKAYGAGVFSLEDLKEYTTPIRERVSDLDKRINNIKQEQKERGGSSIPNENEIEEFAKDTSDMLKSFNFGAKREIMLSAIEKVVGNQNNLQVYGKIPIKNYYEYKTIHRNCRIT